MQSITSDELAELRLDSEPDDPLLGWLVGDSAERLLLETVVDGAFHGWRIIPTAGVRDIATTRWTAFASRALADKRHALRPGLASIDASWPALLRSVESVYGVIGVTQGHDPDAIYIGRILSWSANTFALLTVDSDGTIDPDPIHIQTSTISQVEFGSPYNEMYTQAVDWDAAVAAHG